MGSSSSSKPTENTPLQADAGKDVAPDVLRPCSRCCCTCLLDSDFWRRRPWARCCLLCWSTTALMVLTLLFVAIGISNRGDCLNLNTPSPPSNETPIVDGWNGAAGNVSRRAEAEEYFGVTTARSSGLFHANAWTNLTYAKLQRNLYITQFDVERRTWFNTLVQLLVLTMGGPIAWRTHTLAYDELFGSRPLVRDPIAAYVSRERRFVDNGDSFGTLFPGELVLQTLVESDAEAAEPYLVYVFEGAIRGRVRIRMSTQLDSCFDLAS